MLAPATDLLHKKVTDDIIGAAIDVHRTLGAGLLESTYEACLSYELTKRNRLVTRQQALPLKYKDVELDCGYRIDLIVDQSVIIEVKSVEETAPIHLAQMMTYLRLSGIRVGLLINFNVRKLIDGIERRVI